MLKIIWRGAGILIPILFFLSGWITSYWYDDVTLGNTEYMKWTLLGPGILLTLIGLVLLPIGTDEETGKKKYVGNHDMFWIPMVVWGILFLSISIKFFVTDTTAENETEFEEVYAEEEEDKAETEAKDYVMNEKGIKEGERVVKIYNPTSEPITVYVYPPGKGDDALSGDVPAKDHLFIALAEGDHVVQFNNTKKEFSVKGSSTIDNYDSDDVWIVLADDMDLLLVDVTASCSKITKTELREIDWSGKLHKRYNGNEKINMDVKQTEGKYFEIREPYYNLPISHTDKEHIYSIIPIPSADEATDEFIEEFIISICWKEEGVVLHFD
jgi:hypothetical protein